MCRRKAVCAESEGEQAVARARCPLRAARAASTAQRTKNFAKAARGRRKKRGGVIFLCILDSALVRWGVIFLCVLDSARVPLSNETAVYKLQLS